MENMISIIENFDMTDVARMTVQQRNMLKEALNETDKIELKRELERVANAQALQSTEIEILKTKTENQGAKIELLDEEVNILGSRKHSKRRKDFKKACSKRVYEVLGGSTNYKFVLFAPFFFRSIYKDIADSFDIDTYMDLKMKDYKDPNSDYEIAKDLAELWDPKRHHINYCVSELIEKRDLGILRADRCRALTEYLLATNNNNENIFA